MDEKLSETQKEQLITDSLKAKELAYARYSHFRVGCSLLMKDGTIITGCNVENVSYGLTICAERTAYTKAVSEGKQDFKAVFVSTDVEKGFVWPCGACRQFMSEFGDVEVYAVNNKREYEQSTLNELLPKAFQYTSLCSGQEYFDKK